MEGSADSGVGTRGSRATILLVEDERDQRLVTATYLESNGYIVAEAATAAAARGELARREVDVVVLDLGLPDEDGLELLRRSTGGPRSSW